MPIATELKFERNAKIPTWFGIGGGADRLVRPTNTDDLRRCLELDPDLRVLGDGANLLVDDAGVRELVVAFTAPEMTSVRRDDRTGLTIAMAGASLPRLITESVRLGMGGLEGLGGIPATVGGAVIMNAGGKFGQISDAVRRVHALDRSGRDVTLEREQIEFGYRHSGLNRLIVTSVALDLRPGDAAALRARLLEVMAYKKESQPMADKSAGCVFKNPTLDRDIDGIGRRGDRVGAGMLLDRAGCKGMSVGGATISPRHANFFVTGPGARAADVITLMELGADRVLERFGLRLQPEVVVWRRG